MLFLSTLGAYGQQQYCAPYPLVEVMLRTEANEIPVATGVFGSGTGLMILFMDSADHSWSIVTRDATSAACIQFTGINFEFRNLPNPGTPL